jgi:hypothetical protein
MFADDQFRINENNEQLQNNLNSLSATYRIFDMKIKNIKIEAKKKKTECTNH